MTPVFSRVVLGVASQDPDGWWLFLNGKLTGSKGRGLKKGLTNWAET